MSYQHAVLQNIILNSLNQSDILAVDLIAFDTVSHRRLLSKLNFCRVSGNIFEIMKNSNYFQIKSGIPQSGVSSPVLFNLYINDLPFYISSCILQFSDDKIL